MLHVPSSVTIGCPDTSLPQMPHLSMVLLLLPPLLCSIDFAICIILVFPLTCWAKTYEWVDEKGTVNFTQDYNSVPEKYRGQVKERPDEPGGTPPKEKSEKALKGSSGKESHKEYHPEAGSGHKGDQPVNKNRVEADAADGLKLIVSLWKDERYETLYDYGTASSKTSISRERFVQTMRKKSPGLATSWETLQSIEAQYKSPTLVYVTAKIGQRSRVGGDIKTLTETYPMKLEKGVWKTDLSKILSASHTRRKKGVRSH